MSKRKEEKGKKRRPSDEFNLHTWTKRERNFEHKKSANYKIRTEFCAQNSNFYTKNSKHKERRRRSRRLVNQEKRRKFALVPTQNEEATQQVAAGSCCYLFTFYLLSATCYLLPATFYLLPITC